MATLTIRKLDDSTKSRLRMRAAEKGLSMEEEARRILRRAVYRDGEMEPGIGSVRGRWKGRFTTDEIMRETRGE